MADPLAPTKPMPQKTSVFSAFLLAISLSLIFFAFYFLSFGDNIFWFVLSNAIIFLIAAADFDSAPATSSFKHKPDLYDEYLRSIRARTSFSALVPEAREEDKKDPDSADSPPPPQEPVPESTQKESCPEETEKKAIVAVDNGELRSDGGDFWADEELNRRVEDFIRMFRETQLQEMREEKT